MHLLNLLGDALHCLEVLGGAQQLVLYQPTFLLHQKIYTHIDIQKRKERVQDPVKLIEIEMCIGSKIRER